MLSPTRFLVAAGLLALATVAPSPAHAARVQAYAVPCAGADASTWTYSAKPKSCRGYDQLSDPTASYVFATTKLKWKRWGAKSATASGHVKTAALDADVTIKASGLKKCSSKLTIYTKLVFMLPDTQNAKFATESGIPCPTRD